MALLIVFVVIAIGVSFLCSILEAALLSITPSYVETVAAARPTLAERLRELRTDIERPLAAILSLNTIAHTVGATGAGAQAALVFGDAGVGIFSAVLTLGILILSEIIPKTLGATYWRPLAPFVVSVLPWLIRLQLPLVWMSQWLTRVLTRGHKDAGVSREEIAALTTVGRRLGVVQDDEGRIVENLFRLDAMTVAEIMTPRTVIDALPETMTAAEVIASTRRVPLLPPARLRRATVDDVTGFVLTREMLLAGVKGRGDVPVGEFRRDLPRVPETMTLDALFDFLVEKDRHIALVEDGFGGTAGVVTLEDLIETLLGTEIVDEQDSIADLQGLARRRAPRGVRARRGTRDGGQDGARARMMSVPVS